VRERFSQSDDGFIVCGLRLSLGGKLSLLALIAFMP
jgi:hypothetical protein